MTEEQIYEKLKNRLGKIIPDFELREKAKIAAEIEVLKKERNAVILGHNYMEPALFNSVPDFTGDSLELSRKAADADADVIVFCGVKFMAETAKILSPDKTVLLPAKVAGCSLASSITAEDVRQLKKQFPGVPVVTYINTYADVKAECDMCCTSGNAKAVVESLDSEAVIFLPDEYLAKNVALETNKRIIFPTHEPHDAQPSDVLDYQMIGWHGKCEVHDQFRVEDIENARRQFPGVKVLAHPECPPEICQACDFTGSTSAMITYVQDQPTGTKFLLMTECSMADNIAAENPDKEMVSVCSVRCPHMNEITLEETRDALKYNQQIIELDEDVRVKAKKSVDRMLEIGPSGTFSNAYGDGKS